MKFHLVKLSLALLSVAFLLGCQDQGSEPVGPDGLGPQFAKVKNCDPDMGEVHPSCKDGDGDGETVTVTLTGGMTGMVTGLTVFSDNNKKFSMNTGRQSEGEITTHFDDTGCSVEDPRGDAAAVTTLKSQLSASIDVSTSLILFQVQVDRTKNEDNVLEMTYDLAGFGEVILGWAHRSPPSVSENPAEVFVFSGGQIRVGEDEGRPKDRIRVLCPSPSEPVTVTVSR